MFTDDSWFTGGPATKYGGSFLRANQAAAPASGGGMSELPTVAATPTASALDGLKPGTGFFAFAVIAAVSLGLMAASTTVRVGGASASASVGKS